MSAISHPAALESGRRSKPYSRASHEGLAVANDPFAAMSPQLSTAQLDELMDSLVDMKERNQITNDEFDFFMSAIVAKVAEVEVCQSLDYALGSNLVPDLLAVMGDKS